MHIFCDIRKVNEKVADIESGEYLYIEFNNGTKSCYIPYDKFYKMYRDAKEDKIAILVEDQEVEVADIEPTISISSRKSLRPDFGELMNFLRGYISIDFDNLTKDDNEITVSSESSMLLELPWEKIVDKDIFIFREVFGKEEMKFGQERDNLLMLMSHAHEGVGNNMKKNMDEEISKIYNYLLKNEQQPFRIDSSLLLKHTTKNLLGYIKPAIKDYSYLHAVLMHGLSNGSLCLEKDDKVYYEHPDIATISEFLSFLEKGKFKLIFLSFCFSGGGLDNDNDNLSFQIIKNNIAMNVISYNHGIGENTALNFSNYFYQNLANGGDVKKIYKISLKKYYDNYKQRTYIPLLYTMVNTNI